MIKAHIYSQEYQHSEAYIVGDREALELIMTACRDALGLIEVGTTAAKVAFYCNDGEGYDLHIICLEDKDKWRQMAEPYPESISGPQETSLWPWQLITAKGE